MEFRDNQAVYLQIVDYVCEQILMKNWKAEQKILSIRDLAIELQVTPNTVQRSYDFIQQLDIISNQRGIGFFVEKDAIKKILIYKKEDFMSKELPIFFKNLHLLKLDLKEIESLYNNYIKSLSKK
ncbi:MAG TPA: GntR family transcriptional regulator [Candidatus Paceibacterota bacterium]|nr:GntR family transcriptional regulator [Candidatus Paceibacterota bacterium]